MSEVEMWVTDRHGDKIAPLPDANLGDMGWILNDSDTMEFTIDPLSEGAVEIEGIAREIQVWLDGSLEWTGTPWGLDGNSQEITVTCEGLESLFTKRFVDRMSMFYTSIDQFSIAWDLLNYAQSEAVEANRDFFIDASNFQPSGVVRSREWKREEHPNILDCLKEFDSRILKNGFDWEIIVTQDGGRFWTPYYPKKGQPRPEQAIEWDSEGERNISDFNWNEDFVGLATLAYVTGGSHTIDGVTVKMEGKHEDVEASEYWGQMQTVMSDGSQMDVAWLDDKAEQEVESRKDPKVVTEITAALGVENLKLGDVKTGDWVPVKIDHGRVQVDAWHRVTEIAWHPNDTLDLIFGEVVAA